MTIEKLEQFYGIASGIEAIETEINQLYNPVKSPVGSGTHSTQPSAPTERSAMRIIDLKEQLEAERKRMLDLAEEIEHWLVTVDDSEIVSIIRWHYILRLTWKQTNMKVYGYPDYRYARQKVYRYIKKS